MRALARLDLCSSSHLQYRGADVQEHQPVPHEWYVAIRLGNLGSVRQRLGDLEGACVAFERALAIDEIAFGPNHLRVGTRVSNLGSVQQDLGDLKAARAAFARALAIFQTAFGAEHELVLGLRTKLLDLD
jgi:tetratricopeptide (TPR) repeat protein